MKRIIFALAAVLGMATAQAQALTDLDAAGAFLAQQSGKPLRAYSTRDFGREKFSQARSVVVDAAKAQDLVRLLRSRAGSGLIVFQGTDHSLATVPVEGTEVVVAKGRSQFDIVRVAATDAVNYDMGTEDLIRRLKQWDAAYGIDIYQASTDTIQLRLKQLPPDLHAFAAQLYAFCPDIVDQGVGTVEKLEQSLRESHVVNLWWD